MKLALTLPIRKAQTASSYISSIAAFNGSLFAQDFCQDMLIKWRGITNGDPEELDLLAELSGVERIHFDRHGVVCQSALGSWRTYKINGNHITLKQLFRGRLRVCPQCLLADREEGGPFAPAGRSYWQISSIRTCAIHNIVLLDLPDAEFPRDMHDFAARVRDHWPLVEAGAANCNERVASSFERYLINRIEGLLSSHWLDDLPFDVVAKTAEMLGLAFVFGSTKSFNKSSGLELAEAGRIGFDLLAAGHEKMQSAFRKIQDRSKGARAGYYTDFGHFARWLERMLDDDRYEPIRAIFRKYVFENYPIGPGEKVLGTPCPKRSLHSFATIRKNFDINPVRLKHLLSGMGFAQSKDTDLVNAQSLGYFPADESEAAISGVADALDRLEAVDRLGIHRDGFDRLRKAGFIEPVVTMLGVKCLFSPTDLDVFLGNLLDESHLVAEPSSHQVRLTSACSKTKHQIQEFIPLILERKLNWIGKLCGEQGISAILVDINEVLDYFETPLPPGYTKRDLKKLLRVNDPTITYLVKRRFLQSKIVPHPRSKRPMALISEESYNGFLEQYVTLGILANQIGTQAKHIASRLDKLEVNPIKLPKRYSKIYDRSAVSPLFEGADQAVPKQQA